jgi:hypothetical protein
MTEENYKKLGNWVPVSVLFIQLLIFVAAANAQIGCTKTQIAASVHYIQHVKSFLIIL